MIGQHPRSGLDLHILKAPRVQQLARYLRTCDPILRTDLGVFGHIGLDTPLRISPQEQARKNKEPEKRVFKHLASVVGFATRRNARAWSRGSQAEPLMPQTGNSPLALHPGGLPFKDALGQFGPALLEWD